MKISEKQLAQLLLLCQPMIVPSTMLAEQTRETLRDLLIEIANQQSNELKDVE